MKIFAYHANCPAHDMVAELRLLTLWREHWTGLGFEPWVLNEWTARQHPYFEEYDREIRKLPSVNSASYELACWHRWLALAQVGGGFMSDYDVFAVKNLAGQVLIDFEAKNKLHLFQSRNVCPSFIWATAPTALKLCQTFATGKYGQADQGTAAHFSDMYAIEQLVKEGADWIELHDVVRDYQGSEGWEKAPLIHFSNSAMSPKGLQPRWQHIPRLLKELAPR